MTTRHHHPHRRREAYALFQLLVLLALLALLAGVLLPAVQKVRSAAARMQSSNNLKQIGLALHNYHDANNAFPAGNDAQNLSGFAYLLPYIEQDALYKKLDLTRGPDDKANAEVRAALVKIFESPLDPVQQPEAKAGPTSYLLVAGDQPALAGNNGIFTDGALKITDITDGTSNTMMAVEVLKGDGGKKAVTVQRQHVRLKAADLKGIKESTGVKDFEDGKNIAGNRGASWLDGRYLRSTMSITRGFNDEKPDVDCGGAGGHAGPRSLLAGTTVLMADGSVRFVSSEVKLSTWQEAATRGSGNPLPGDF